MALKSTNEELTQRVKSQEKEAKKNSQKEAGLREVLEQSRHKSSKEISALLENYRTMLTHQRFIDVARTLYDLCGTLIGSTAGYVALLDETCTENEILFLDSGGLPCTVDPNLPMPIRGLRAEAYSDAETVYHNNYADSKWIDLMPEGHVMLNNVLFAPLVLEGRAVGVMGFANKPEDFLESDAQLASLFANLAAVVLNNSKAKQRWQNKEEET
jgi:GAF domain-containing protein